jgi:ATP-dependent DNA helicase RecQ
MPKDLRCEEGRALCRWGDPGWGDLVRQGKHTGRFDDALVEAAAELISVRWRPEPALEWIAYVPSLRHSTLLPDFAHRLAARLHLPVVECIQKVKETPPQKMMNYSWNQARNLAGAFRAHRASAPSGAVLLVDDMVDSKWTFTIIGALLRESGSGPVFPFALADSSQSGE